MPRLAVRALWLLGWRGLASLWGTEGWWPRHPIKRCNEKGGNGFRPRACCLGLREGAAIRGELRPGVMVICRWMYGGPEIRQTYVSDSP
jgi:hypothetical protein